MAENTSRSGLFGGVLGRIGSFGARIRGSSYSPIERYEDEPEVSMKHASTREYSRDADLQIKSIQSVGLGWTDALITKHGLEIFDEMLENDAQIANAYHLKKYMRLVHGWDIRPFEEGDKESEEIAKFVKWNFTEFLEGSVSSFLDKMWDALRLGYKVAELIWEPIPRGEYEGMIGLRKLKVRKSHNYRFDTDEHGNLRPRGLLEMSGNWGETRRLPVRKFVIFSWGGLDDDGVSLYGRSEFRVAYRYYIANDFIHTKWLRRLEDISNPCPVAEVSETQPMTDEERQIITEEIAKLNHLASYVPPAGVKIGMWPTGFGSVSGGKTSESGFVEALNWNSQMASKALLVGSLVQQEGKVSGSYALGKIHFETLIHCLEQLGRITSDQLMREQVIQRLVDLNYDTDKYPRFHMPSLVEEDPVPRAKVAEILINTGVINSQEPWVRDYVGVPSNLSWKSEEQEMLPTTPVKAQPASAQIDNAKTSIKPASDQAVKQVVDQNKEYVAINTRKLKSVAKRFFMEQFVEGVNERVDPDAPGNPQWATILKGIQRFGIGVSPLPNSPVPMDIYVHVGDVADRFAHALAGAYKEQLERDCQETREQRWFRKLGRDERASAIERVAEEAFCKAHIEECLGKWGTYFRAGQTQTGGV